jgi:hypothetical protein
MGCWSTNFISSLSWQVDEPHWFLGQGVKGQGKIEPVGKSCFQITTWQPIDLWPSNCIGALVLASKWPLFIWGKGVKGQGHINLIGKNSF